jgi:hypothetical protein
MISNARGPRAVIYLSCRSVIKSDQEIVHALLPNVVKTTLQHGTLEELNQVM